MGSLMNLTLKDVYQLLITTCRYAYTRNNHLVPATTFEQVLGLVKKMNFYDSDYAIYTAKQLCEECISLQINTNFENGIDDEFQNLKESRKFVLNLLDFIGSDYKPYNYDLFLANLEKDKLPRYAFYDEFENVLKADVSEEHWLDELCKLAGAQDTTLKYRKEPVSKNLIKFTILEPKETVIYRKTC